MRSFAHILGKTPDEILKEIFGDRFDEFKRNSTYYCDMVDGLNKLKEEGLYCVGPTDDQFITIYDKIGHRYFNHGDDEQLKQWGNSPTAIRKIKVDAVKSDLYWHRKGIETYKLLNELMGGINEI